MCNKKECKQPETSLNKADVMRLLPDGDTINKAADHYGFRGPYDGSNNFYDEVAIKHFLAGIRFVEQHVSDELDGNNVECMSSNTTDLITKI